MEKKPIVLYGIGGLGADHRVFKYLTLEYELRPIVWIEPIGEEDLHVYTKRIVAQIDESESFGLIGVSFGGMVAIELNKLMHPIFTILISSVAKSTDLPYIRTIARKLNLLPLLPNALLKPPFFIMKYLFSARNSKLLKEIIDDTGPTFLRWAIGEIIDWNSNADIENLYRIHGSKDKLIPSKNESPIIIKNGGHFMIVDNAAQISKHINTITNQYSK